MILFVAPYNGDIPERSNFLAGSSKIRLLVKVLLTFDPCVVLLNSSHELQLNSPTTFQTIDFGEGQVISVVTPPTRKNKYIGRISNLICANSIVDSIVEKYGRPKLAWFYNGYAFEMRAAVYLRRKFGVRTVLEFEDWHFARNRGLSPKPILDWLCWRVALKRIDYAFAVNSYLKNKLSDFHIPTDLLPGVVSEYISDLSWRSLPFEKDYITVGYFGGLSSEKGASTILNLANLTGNSVRFIVTGSGPRRSEFVRLSHIFPNRFRFLGAVSEEELVLAMSQADLIVNPHQINSGIFPFKIVEGLASGRLVISTELPMNGYEMFRDAIQFYSGNLEELRALVLGSRDVYLAKKDTIRSVATEVNARYGRVGLRKAIRRAIIEVGDRD